MTTIPRLKLAFAVAFSMFFLPLAVIADPQPPTQFSVLHEFGKGPAFSGALIQGSDGNFYGTTSQWYSDPATVFKMTPSGIVTILHSFSPVDPNPVALTLIQGADGNFYGTTGASVFTMTPAGSVTTLHSFDGVADGQFPVAPLVQATDRSLYGTTIAGGAFDQGTIFKITPTGTMTTLHSFKSRNTDGGFPYGALIQATDGNFYGTTLNGGASNGGIVFRMAPDGAFTVLHVFGPAGTARGTVFTTAPDDALAVLHAIGPSEEGAAPASALVEATDGTFYGTTTSGGSNGLGTVFRITSTGDFHVLYSFGENILAGFHPITLIQGANGNFYGTSSQGSHGVVFTITTAGFLSVLSGDVVGGSPSSLIQATDGNLYGTAGGVFKLSPTGVIHRFGGDGANPRASLIQATDQQFYGTTSSDGLYGHGTVFAMNGVGTVTVVAAFSGAPSPHPVRGGCPPGITPPGTCGGDGANPKAGLIQARDGNFYGTTYDGGSIACPFGPPGATICDTGRGTIFKMTTSGSRTNLHVFNGFNDGGPNGAANPEAALLQAADGRLYGTTRFGGTSNAGTVFNLTENAGGPFAGWTLTILHVFGAGADGAEPRSALIQATDGNFYGTTASGGGAGQGTVFRMAADGTLVILHAFSGPVDGANPRAALIQATDGNFYGTTENGGAAGFGTVFKMTPGGTVSVVYAFSGGADGANPRAALIQATDGKLYGTTAAGAGGRGTVFTMTLDGTVTVLPAFRSRREGAGSSAALVQAADANFYGTTDGGGAFESGVLFRLRSSGRGGRSLDLNGDGAPDVFLHNAANGSYSFQTKSQAAGFDSTFSFQAWDPGWQVYPARLNGDTFSDVFLYNPAQGIWVQALNAGDATFSYAGGSWDRNWTIVPADLDGDGLTDMFVYNATTGVWAKCFVDGSGGFKGYTAGTWDPGWTFSSADLNGDGRDDFLLYNRVNGVWVEALSQEGFGTFDYPASGRWDPGWQVYTADLNGDGRADLFLLNAAGVHVSALGRADGGFDYAGGPQWSAGWSVSAGDLDNDGTTDLFLYNATTGVWVEAFSDGVGGFTYASGKWDAGWSVALTDFNQDGRGDLILSRADGTWVQATNTGAATFSYAVGNWGTGWTVFAAR